MESVFIAMVVFTFVGAVTPGPVNLVATSTAAQYGKQVAAMHVLGASVAYAIVVFITGSALSGFAEWLPKLELAMKLAGSAFLCFLAYKVYTAPFEQMETSAKQRISWINGALIQLLNPKAWLVAMSGVSLFVIGQDDQQVWLWGFTIVSLVACMIGVGVWVMMGTVLTQYLQSTDKQRQFNRMMALLLLASVLMIWM